VVRWAAERYHRCLLEAPFAEAARRYIGDRRLSGETVRRFGLGFAPPPGDWLLRQANEARIDLGILEQVGLIAPRQEGNGYYDRFRDRVLFPIRDRRGQPVGFGGRIMPSSPMVDRAPKYYNSADTVLFKKSECLYGLDTARQAAATAGYLAVVEGYTDVLMAQQMGIGQVVATMGTALNARHVQQLRAFAPRVILVFDADAGGDTGADRALQIFASQNVDLAVATLPEGLDPCDLLVERGPEPFLAALANAVDALEFKLDQVLKREAAGGVEGKRRAVDAVLSVLALSPEMPGQDGAIKRDLMLTRIAQRFALQEEIVRLRLKELREARRDPGPTGPLPNPAPRTQPAAAEERELLEVLLAEPSLVGAAAEELPAEEVKHPGLRQLLEELYRMHAAGETPDLDQLRLRIDNPHLADSALRLQDRGQREADRPAWFGRVLRIFRERRLVNEKRDLQNQLHAAPDHDQALELLRRLQNQRVGTEP